MKTQLLNRKEFLKVENLDFQSLFDQLELQKFQKVILTHIFIKEHQDHTSATIFLTADKNVYKAISKRKDKDYFSVWKIEKIKPPFNDGNDKHHFIKIKDIEKSLRENDIMDLRDKLDYVNFSEEETKILKLIEHAVYIMDEIGNVEDVELSKMIGCDLETAVRINYTLGWIEQSYERRFTDSWRRLVLEFYKD